MSKRFLMIGAHPDDADIRFGGTAALLTAAGHQVKFVSLCNGNCGHFAMSGAELANRRYAETQASKAVSGITEYQVLMENNDCELVPDIENRKKVIRIIREFQPDVVLGHRLCDYHADHRAAAQLVQDATYLVMVPKFCPETPIPEKTPVYGYVWDHFVDPTPFTVDAIVPVDSVMDIKCKMLDCHVSQVYEWLAWEMKADIDHKNMSWEEKKAFLIKNWGARYIKVANENRDKLVELYGEAGKTVEFAEAFSFSPYGGRSGMTAADFQKFFKDCIEGK